MSVGLSPSRKHRAKTGAGQDARDGFTLVTLNLDPAFLHRATDATGFLHLFGEVLFLCLPKPDKTRDDRHGLAAAVRGLTNDIDPPAVFLWKAGKLLALPGELFLAAVEEFFQACEEIRRRLRVPVCNLLRRE